MIKRVLLVSLVAFVIALGIFWIFTGGWAAISRTAHSLSNPIDFIFGTSSTTGAFIRLPWQPEHPTRGPDISVYFREGSTGKQESETDDRSSDVQPVSPRTFGNPSPYAGKVTITENTATESNPAQEFIRLTASLNNTEPVRLENWSLQSAVSGARFPIPQAAPLFILGIVNNVEGISLAPGASVFITTAGSPVGTSFRENICSGYLNDIQRFTPEPYRSFPSNTMSYNDCVNTYRNRTPFALPSFRAYLALRSELWDNSHDIIRILDDRGRIVDMLTY